MITERIRKGIAQRSSVDDEWEYGVQQSWSNILAIISENLEDTVCFIEHNCTGDELSWLSEVFNEIIDIFPTKRIIDALRKAAEKYPAEVKKYHINSCIDEAEGHLAFILSTQNTEATQ